MSPQHCRGVLVSSSRHIQIAALSLCEDSCQLTLEIDAGSLESICHRRSEFVHSTRACRQNTAQRLTRRGKVCTFRLRQLITNLV